MIADLNLNELADQGALEGAPSITVQGQEIICLSAFQTPQSQAAVYRLLPGQRIPAHTHSAIDDIFLGLRGTGRIRTWDTEGTAADHRIEAGSLVVVTPDTPHEVSCAGEEFCYVLLQAPKELYDNIGYEAPEV